MAVKGGDRMKDLSYDEVYLLWNLNRVSNKQVAEWFPEWVKGKGSYRMNDGVPEGFVYSSYFKEGGFWEVITWVYTCMQNQ